MQVELEPTVLTAIPGEPTPCTIRVHNDEPRDVSATLRVLGVPTDEAGFTTVQLRPGTTTTVVTQVLMPIGSPGGTHPFRVEVLTESGAISVRGEVVIQEASSIHLALSPSGISGNWRGHLLVSIHNRGSETADLALSGEGDDHRVRFRFDHRRLQVMPGERINVTTRVTSRRPATGDPVTRRFTVRARGAAIPLNARGTFRQTPVFDRSLSKILAVLVVLSVWISAVGVGLAVITNRQTVLSALGIGDDEGTTDGGDADGDGTGADPGGDPGAPGEGDPGDGGTGDGDTAAGPEATDESPAGTPRVTGFVRDADGNGLSGVGVTAAPATLGTRPAAIAVEAFQGVRGKRLGGIAPDLRPAIRTQAAPVADDGSYTVPVNEPGAYYLEFRLTGFQTTKHLVVFGADLAPVGLDVTLQRANGALRGTVVPASAARISVTDGVARYETVADDASGQWEVAGVSVPAEFVVSAIDAHGDAASKVVAVGTGAAGTTFDTGTLTITSGVTSLSGVVCDSTDATLAGVPGALVTATAGDGSTFTTTTTDGVVDDAGIEGAGRFVFNGLPIGQQYDVTVAADGFVTMTRRFTTPGFHEDCVALSGATGGLAGTVGFGAAKEKSPTTSGISVKAISATNSYATTVGEKDDDGFGPFAIDGMEPGDYVVSITRPDIGTIVRTVQIIPPGIVMLDVEVEQVDTDASLSTSVRFVLEGDGNSFRSAVDPSLSGLTVTVPGIDLDDLLTDGVTAEGTLDEVAQLPLGRHRLRLTAVGHESVSLPFIVLGEGDPYLVDLTDLDRPGAPADSGFDGELRPLANLRTEFVSGLGPAKTLVEATATLRKVLTPDGDEPARGLTEYGPVDPGTFNAITTPAPVETMTLTRRLSSGFYVLTPAGTPPAFHWINDTPQRFDVDLRTNADDAKAASVGPTEIVFPRYPVLDITLDSTAGPDQLDTIERVIRTVGLVDEPGAVTLCADDTLPTAVGKDPETPVAADTPTIAYPEAELPDPVGNTITIPFRSVRTDEDTATVVTVIACRTDLEPTVVSTDPLLPNMQVDVPLPINPATIINLYWMDATTAVERADFTDGMTVSLSDGPGKTITFTSAGDGRYQSAKPDPTKTYDSDDLTVILNAAYPGYAGADESTFSINGGDTTDVELVTRPAVVTVPVFQTLGADFSDLVVTATDGAGATHTGTYSSDPFRSCSDLTAPGDPGPSVRQCDFLLDVDDSGITRGVGGEVNYGGGAYTAGETFTFRPNLPLCVECPRSAQIQVLADWEFGGPILVAPPGQPGATMQPEFGDILVDDGRLLNGYGPFLQYHKMAYALPRGSYDVTLSKTGDPDGLYAANSGTVDITPDKSGDVRLGDALFAIVKPTVTIDVVDQNDADLPGPTDPDLPITSTQAAVTETQTKTDTAPVSFRVVPTNLEAQVTAFNAVTPARDPSGAAEIPLTATVVDPTDPGDITVALDLTDTPFAHADPAGGTFTIADTTVGDPIARTFKVVRLSSIAIAVKGDLRADPAENELLLGAQVTMTFDFGGVTDHTGTIGQYSTGPGTWADLVLTDGASPALTTLALGDANLRLRRLRIPGCPGSCTATIDFAATHPDFAGPSNTLDVALVQGDTPTVDVLVVNAIERTVSGTFATTKDRLLVNTAVCVTATPEAGSKFTTTSAPTYTFGFERDDPQEWAIDIYPRTQYIITATAEPCAGGTAGNYDPPAALTIRKGAAGPGVGDGSGDIEGQSLLFTAGGATITGTVEGKYPDNPDGDESRSFIGCAGTECPTVTLRAVATPGTIMGTATVDPVTGTFTLTDTDVDGKRVQPNADDLDQLYFLRITGKDFPSTDVAIGTLVENQIVTLPDPAFVTLSSYTVTLTLKSGDTTQPGEPVTITRQDADFLAGFATDRGPITCTTEADGDCAPKKLIPGEYLVDGPAGSSVVAVTGDDPPADAPAAPTLDLTRPVTGPPARAITVQLGFEVAISVIYKNGPTETPIAGALVTFTKTGTPDVSCTTTDAGTCTISGAEAVKYDVAVTDLIIQKGSQKTYTVVAAPGNAHTVEVDEPTISFVGVPDGTIVESDGETCTMTAGVCRVTLSGGDPTTNVTAIAYKAGQAATLTYQWRTTRTVDFAGSPMADRVATFTVKDKNSATLIQGITVTATPSGPTGGTAKDCSPPTNGVGQCTITALHKGAHTFAIDNGTVTPTSGTVPSGPTAAFTLQMSAPTITFTTSDPLTTISLSGGATGSCTTAAGTTCTITLGGGVEAGVDITVTADSGTKIGTTTFQWATARTVDVPQVSRTRTITLQDGAPTPAAVPGKTVRFVGPGTHTCLTDADGSCPISDVAAGTYTVTIDGEPTATVSPATYVVTTAATGTQTFTYTPPPPPAGP